MIDRINIESLGMTYCDYIQIYLPADYYLTNQKYDLIYMHDGHNLFDVKTSAFGTSWHIDQLLSKREEMKLKSYIIVGIECPNVERFSLYSPWKSSLKTTDHYEYYHQFGGKGTLYIQWMIQKLFPYIESQYRFSGKRYMAGSSMGGFITICAGIQHPTFMNAIGVFSPAIWFAKKQLLQFVNRTVTNELSLYLDIGHLETSDLKIDNFNHIYLNDARSLNQILIQKKLIHYVYYEDEIGEHNELAWGRRFINFLDFIERLDNTLI